MPDTRCPCCGRLDSAEYRRRAIEDAIAAVEALPGVYVDEPAHPPSHVARWEVLAALQRLGEDGDHA